MENDTKIDSDPTIVTMMNELQELKREREAAMALAGRALEQLIHYQAKTAPIDPDEWRKAVALSAEREEQRCVLYARDIEDASKFRDQQRELLTKGLQVLERIAELLSRTL